MVNYLRTNTRQWSTPLDPKPLPLYINPNILLIGNGLVVAQLG
jgi:hypothetical protein